MKSAVQDRLRAYLEGKRDYAAALLCDLIPFASTPGAEAATLEFLLAKAKQTGVAARPVAIDDGLESDADYTPLPEHVSYAGRPNLLIEIRGCGAGKSALLNTHMDVVPAPADLFVPRVENGTVYGRGACDAKGQIVTVLLVVEALRDLGISLEGDVLAEFVIEEEAGGNGSLSLIRQGYRADAAIVLEPTALCVCPANRGAVWYELGVTGKSVHMGSYRQGVNAIDSMIEFVGVLRDYERQLREQSRGNPLFSDDPSPVYVNLGRIAGGDWPSTLAGECSLEGGIAFLPNKRIPDIASELRAMLDAAGLGEYSLAFARLHNEAFETPIEHPSVKALVEAVGSVVGPTSPIGMVASCDARLFYHRGGMPTIVFGPGDLANAHSLVERIEVDDILSAARVLVSFLMDWCGVHDGKER